MAKILYFATLRERMQRPEEDLPLPPGIGTVAALIAWLSARDPAGTAAFSQPSLVRAAVNQEVATQAAPIRDTDEIAFFPPVTGG